MAGFESPVCSSCKNRVKSIFCKLQEEEALLLNTVKTCVHFKKGDTIFQEGSYPRGLYCINTGKVKIFQIGNDGKEQIVHLANDADVMGYRALLGGDKYSCSAIALEDTNLCFIPKSSFISLVEKTPKVALQLIHLLSNELKETEKKITNIAQYPVRDRLALGLLTLKSNYGLEDDNATINVIIKREDLANIAGTTRETTIRLLYEFQEQNLIELVSKKIKILNEAKLIEIAHTSF